MRALALALLLLAPAVRAADPACRLRQGDKRLGGLRKKNLGQWTVFPYGNAFFEVCLEGDRLFGVTGVPVDIQPDEKRGALVVRAKENGDLATHRIPLSRLTRAALTDFEGAAVARGNQTARAEELDRTKRTSTYLEVYFTGAQAPEVAAAEVEEALRDLAPESGHLADAKRLSGMRGFIADRVRERVITPGRPAEPFAARVYLQPKDGGPITVTDIPGRPQGPVDATGTEKGAADSTPPAGPR